MMDELEYKAYQLQEEFMDILGKVIERKKDIIDMEEWGELPPKTTISFFENVMEVM